jgi:hypothetical protein
MTDLLDSSDERQKILKPGKTVDQKVEVLKIEQNVELTLQELFFNPLG